MELEKESIVKVPAKVGRKKKVDTVKKSQSSNLNDQKPMVRKAAGFVVYGRKVSKCDI